MAKGLVSDRKKFNDEINVIIFDIDVLRSCSVCIF